MRSFYRAIGATLLTLGMSGVAAAQGPASGPATGPTSRPVTKVSLKSLVQLRVRDGALELYTDHPPTNGQITVRLDDPPVKAQLRIISSVQEPPPYRPDALDLTIEQVSSEGMIHTTVSSVGNSVQVWRDTTLPDKRTCIVQLVQPGTADGDGSGIRLYVQKMLGEEDAGKSTFPATDFATLVRQYLEPTDEYLRPILETLGGPESLFDVDPALATEVFVRSMQPGAELQKTVAGLVAQLDADRPQDRNAAQGELEKLGQPAVIALRAMDTSKLSLEQQTRIRTILAPQTHAAGVDPAKLRGNLQFLLDALNCRESAARRAALEELRKQSRQTIVLDVDGPEDVRRAKVRELRRQLTPPTTAPATAPATQSAR